MLKKLVWALAIVVVVVIVALAAAAVWVNSLVKAGVEYGASSALGVPITLGQMRIGILRGQAGLSDLNVGNPQGFAAPHFLHLRQGDVQLTLGSLRQNVVEIPRLVLAGIDLRLEKDKDGKANYDLILANLRKSENQPAPTTTPAKAARKFVIRELVLEDVTVHADVISPAGIVKPDPIKIDQIVLHNVGTAGEMNMAEVTGVVLKTTLASAVALGKGILPDDIVGDLGKGLAGLESLAASGVQAAGELGGQIVHIGRGAAEAVGKVTQELGAEAQRVGKELEKGVDQIGQRLEGLLGGKKDEPAK